MTSVSPWMGTPARVRQANTSVSLWLRMSLLILLTIGFSGTIRVVAILYPLVNYAYPAAIIALVLAYVASNGLRDLEVGPVLPIACWTTGFFIYGTLISPYQVIIWFEALKMVVQNLLIVAVLVCAVRTREEAKQLFAMMQWTAIISFVISSYFFFYPESLTFWSTLLYNDPKYLDPTRPGGLWLNPNDAAFCFILIFITSFWLKGILAWAGRSATVLGLLLAASRTGLTLLALVLVIYAGYYLAKSRYSHRTMSLLCGGASVVAFGLLVFFNSSLSNSFVDLSGLTVAQRFGDLDEKNNSITRSELTRRAFNLAYEGPIWGRGLFAFTETPSRRTDFLPALGYIGPLNGTGTLGAHNIYLSVWGESGIIGLLSFLLILGWGVWQTWIIQDQRDRLVWMMAWLMYLLKGLSWHTTMITMWAGTATFLLFHISRVLIRTEPDQFATPK